MITFTTKSIWRLSAVAIGVLLSLLAWFLVIGPQRSALNDARTGTDAANTQTLVLQSRLATLKKNYANLGDYKAQLTALEAALPTTSALPSLLRSLQDAEDASRVTITAVNFGTPVTPSAATAATGTGTATTKSGTSAGAILAVPVTLTVTGSVAHLETFLQLLQTEQPRALVAKHVNEVVPAAATPTATPTPTTTSTSTGASGPTNTDPAATPTLDIDMQVFVDPTRASG